MGLSATGLEMLMAQQHDPDQYSQTGAAGRGEASLIEKGWTVYDAVQHPLGSVTDVDTTSNVLIIDGRPVGLGTFEVPLSLVGSTAGNEVYLSKVVESSASGPDTT